jgi:nitroreductase
MDLYEALYTTRAMRRVASDPVPEDVVARILDAANRAPSGSNAQNWRMLVVDEEDTRRAFGPIYRSAYETLTNVVYSGRREAAEAARDEGTLRVMRSSTWLAENFETVPLWIFFFSRNDPTGSSIYPAVWSAMLAARADGIGTCLTTILGAFEAEKTLDLLSVPADRGWQLAAVVSCGYPTGRWAIAERKPVEEVTYANRWGEPLGFAVDGPLWSQADEDGAA